MEEKEEMFFFFWKGGRMLLIMKFLIEYGKEVVLILRNNKDLGGRYGSWFGRRVGVRFFIFWKWAGVGVVVVYFLFNCILRIRK